MTPPPPFFGNSATHGQLLSVKESKACLCAGLQGRRRDWELSCQKLIKSSGRDTAHLYQPANTCYSERGKVGGSGFPGEGLLCTWEPGAWQPRGSLFGLGYLKLLCVRLCFISTFICTFNIIYIYIYIFPA